MSAGGAAAASAPGGTATTTLSLAATCSPLWFAPWFALVLLSHLNSGPGASQTPALVNIRRPLPGNPGGRGVFPPQVLQATAPQGQLACIPLPPQLPQVQPPHPGREDCRNDPRNFSDMLDSLISGIFCVWL